ncbi:MAG: sensor histidine kinase [Patescibacteria group bacterium]
MKFHGLGAKLTSAFGLISLLPLLLMGIVSIYVFQTTHEQDVATMERSLLRQKINETQKFINETAGLFEIRVGYESTSIIAEKDQQFLLEKLLQENKFIREAAFIDMDGLETVKLSSVQNATLMGLNNVQNLKKFTIAKSGKLYLGDVYQTQDAPMMTISAPVRNSLGQVIMVLSGEVSLRPLRNIYSATTLGNTGYLYVIDKKNVIVGSSDQTLYGYNLENNAQLLSLISVGNENLVTRAGLRPVRVLALNMPISNLGWMAVIEWPVDDAYAAIGNLRYEYAIFFTTVLALVLLIGWLLGRRILKPLETLSRGAEEFGNEKFDYRIKIDTGDEIQDLGEIMNNMAVDLKLHRQALEKSHEKIEEGLREITKLKDDFIFVAAHELRSPVTVLQGYVAEILEDDKTVKLLQKKNPFFLDMIKGIEVSKDRLSTLVDDLLNIARMEAGKFKITLEDNVDINETVKPLVNSMNQFGKPRGIKLEFKTKGKVPPLRVDPSRINELLTNLASNAIKYNKDNGKVTITASFEKKRIYLDVADNGIGMSDEDQKHLFEKFWRSDDVHALQGTGLGLFIVKHMIEQMGGNISFTSVKDKGTTFRFDLPAV